MKGRSILSCLDNNVAVHKIYHDLFCYLRSGKINTNSSLIDNIILDV